MKIIIREHSIGEARNMKFFLTALSPAEEIYQQWENCCFIVTFTKISLCGNMIFDMLTRVTREKN